MKKQWLLALLAWPLNASAELKWERTTGQVTYNPKNKVVRVTFPYQNRSRDTVKIVQVKSGCACCTAAKASKKELAPGEKGELTIRVDLSGKTLPMAKPAIVTTDDGKTEVLVVQILTTDGKPMKVPKWGSGR